MHRQEAGSSRPAHTVLLQPHPPEDLLVYHLIAPNFRELLKSHECSDKNFVIATFFRDYLRATAPARTIHVVAPPTILTRGVGACKNRNNAEPFRILVLRQRLSIRLYALRRRDRYGSLLTFVIRLLLKNVAGTRTVTYTYVIVLAIRQRSLRCTSRSHAHHVHTSDQKSNHENIVPRKFGAIRYTSASRIQCIIARANLHVVAFRS